LTTPTHIAIVFFTQYARAYTLKFFAHNLIIEW